MSLLILVLIYLSVCVGLFKIFAKAGQNGAMAFVPIYNTVIWLEILNKKKWWVVFSIIPVVNIVFLVGMLVDTYNSLGKRDVGQHILGVIAFPVYLNMLAFSSDVKFTGMPEFPTDKKGGRREWAEAIYFALIAATIIRTFVIEAFMIPTPSMEETLRVGDFLFVSKFTYGSRVPMTPVSVPITHQEIPVINKKSYSDYFQLPYMRIPGLSSAPERNDFVVFNYPGEHYRPVDKRTHYIKRCVGVAGDSLKVQDGNVYINGKSIDGGRIRFLYVWSLLVLWNNSFLKKNIEVSRFDRHGSRWIYAIFLTNDQYEIHKNEPVLKKMTKLDSRGTMFFPYEKSEVWSPHNYGSVWIPKEDETVVFNESNYDYLKLCMRNFEGNEFASLSELVKDYRQLQKLKGWSQNMKFAFNRKGSNQSSLSENLRLLKRASDFNNLPFRLAQFEDVFWFRDNGFNMGGGEVLDYAEEAFEYVKNTIYGPGGEFEKQQKVLNQIMPGIVDANGQLNAQMVRSVGGEDKYYLNGEIVKQYTFKQDYYFMMGDNRDESADSRAWGFVPADHLVGSPIFVAFSIDKKAEGSFLKRIRKERLMCFVSNGDVSESRFWYVLIIGLGIHFGLKFWRKKKAAREEE